MQVLRGDFGKGHGQNGRWRVPPSNRRATRRLRANDFPVPGPASTRINRETLTAVAYATELGSRVSSQAMASPYHQEKKPLKECAKLRPAPTSRAMSQDLAGRQAREYNLCNPIAGQDYGESGIHHQLALPPSASGRTKHEVPAQTRRKSGDFVPACLREHANRRRVRALPPPALR